MPTRLQDIIWNAMTTDNSSLCQYNDQIGVFNSEVAPFAGMKNYDEKSFYALHEFVKETRNIAIITALSPAIPDLWKIKAQDELYQMIYPVSAIPSKHIKSEYIKPLTETDIPNMIELTALTKPGPFLQKTILFGPYFGIFDKDKLVSMAGIRLSYDRFREISAVCTHPDYLGKGFAQALMLYMMEKITKDHYTPFLHVRKTNERAIALYQKLGLTILNEMKLNIVCKRK